MSAFVVSGGSLFALRCPASLDRVTEQEPVFSRTLGGRRKAFVRRGGRRSWSVGLGAASPVDVSSLEALARRAGPVGWYGPDAAVGNLLSPQASAFDPTPAGVTGAGLVQLPDGIVAESVTHSGTGWVTVGSSHGGMELAPVDPARPVAVGAWGFGGLQVSVTFRDAQGTALQTVNGEAGTFAGWGWREVSASPVAGAVYVSLRVSGGSAYALPSVSWGSVARREAGSGCPVAVIHSPAVSPVALWGDTNLSSASYQVVEVG